MIDGSICRGTDIVKAIALGADAVAIGRMYCYALAADGDAGVHKCSNCWSTRSASRWRCPARGGWEN